jgi:hypothetical protein
MGAFPLATYGTDLACGGVVCCVLRVCALVAATLVLAGCGGSGRAFLCPTTGVHHVITPLTGRTVVLGGSRVLLDLGTPSLRGGTVVLGRVSNWPGWFALKTHFLARPSFGGGFSVRVRRLDGKGAAGLGGQPPGGAFSAPAGPAANEAGGWRDFPVPATWVRSPGCYQWTISGRGFQESAVIKAKGP